jgi:hypothetical protein
MTTNQRIFKAGLELQVNKLMEEHGYSRREALLLVKKILEDNGIIHKFPNPGEKK